MTSPSNIPAVNETLEPFFLSVRQNKWYSHVATSRTVASSLIATVDRLPSGPIRFTIIDMMAFTLAAYKYKPRAPEPLPLASVDAGLRRKSTRIMAAVTPDFSFPFIVCIGTIFATIRFKRRHRALTHRVRTFPLATHINMLVLMHFNFVNLLAILPSDSSAHAVFLSCVPGCVIGRYVVGSCNTERTCSSRTIWAREITPWKLPFETTGS